MTMGEPALHGGEARGFAADVGRGVHLLHKIVEKRLEAPRLRMCPPQGETPWPSRIRKAVGGPLTS